ncbi:MAG: hypothetical protein AAFR31_13165 [Cyanobacteria bacterium J06627_8]
MRRQIMVARLSNTPRKMRVLGALRALKTLISSIYRDRHWLEETSLKVLCRSDESLRPNSNY